MRININNALNSIFNKYEIKYKECINLLSITLVMLNILTKFQNIY
jgi:hypothetical protein